MAGGRCWRPGQGQGSHRGGAGLHATSMTHRQLHCIPWGQGHRLRTTSTGLATVRDRTHGLADGPPRLDLVLPGPCTPNTPGSLTPVIPSATAETRAGCTERDAAACQAVTGSQVDQRMEGVPSVLITCTLDAPGYEGSGSTPLTCSDMQQLAHFLFRGAACICPYRHLQAPTGNVTSGSN